MRRKWIWKHSVLLVLLVGLLLCTSLVHAKNEDNIPEEVDDAYADEYDDEAYDEEDDTGGLRSIELDDRKPGKGADSDKSSASSYTTTASGTLKSTSTTTNIPVIIFSDVDDHSIEQEDYACPKECSCSEGTKFVNCSHRLLTEIPYNLPSNVLRLDLSHNNLKRLNVEAFQNCTALQELLLANNVIEQFDKELLIRLDKLTFLDLSSNQLSHLDSDSFSEASKSLRRLYLNNNPLALPDDGTFLGLPELEELYLIDCNLTELPAQAFSELGGLTLLDLFGNQFDEDMNVDVFEPLNNLIHLRMPSMSENTVRELCDRVQRIDVIDITKHNISCFYLASDTSFEDSIIVDLPKIPEPVTKEPTTTQAPRKLLKNINGINQDYKSSTSKLQVGDLAFQVTTPQSTQQNVDRKSNASMSSSSAVKPSFQSGSPSSASITHTGAASEVNGDSEVIKTSSTTSNHSDGEQSMLSSITPETMKQLLMAIIGVTVLGLIIGLICRRTGIKNKLCGTKRRPAPTDQVRPAEEVPLNKV
ncbi:slit homolog 2 protein [Anopheles nili]|uniref:slit homolog 2 protein n=1 Tax=Anopheles nili TaxID=185578 RepID=UPI00237AE795|nr:slit homolog 2 protein [Anopheles nili]